MVASRARLQAMIATAHAAGQELQRIVVPEYGLAELKNELGTSSLFAQPTIVVLEETTSLGAKLPDIIPLIAAKAEHHQVIIWEKKSLSKKALEPFSKLKPIPVIQEFKPAPAVFTWLDSLSPKSPKAHQLTLLYKALERADAGLCFAMLQRQVRLLLEIQAGGQPGGPPFMIKKLAGQARHFTQPQLLNLHTKMLAIDIRQKTSVEYLTLSQELALLIMQL